MLDQEKLLEEMVDHHDLQWYEILYLIFAWLVVHRPDAREEYQDGTHPIFFYGPKEGK